MKALDVADDSCYISGVRQRLKLTASLRVFAIATLTSDRYPRIIPTDADVSSLRISSIDRREYYQVRLSDSNTADRFSSQVQRLASEAFFIVGLGRLSLPK